MNLLKRHRYETPSVTVKVDARDWLKELEEEQSAVREFANKIEALQRTQDNQRKEIERLTDIVIKHDTQFMKRIKGL